MYFVADACLLCCVCFSFSVLSQDIGWEERLQNDLFCVGWDVKPKLIQSIMVCCQWINWMWRLWLSF